MSSLRFTLLFLISGILPVMPSAAQQMNDGDASTSRIWVVSRDDSVASDSNAGTAAAPFESIAPAAARAQPGDTVLVHAGVYRERVAPARSGKEGQPIVYQAASGERVVIKGSDRWKPNWKRVHAGPAIYSGSFAAGMFRRETTRQDLPGELPDTYNPYRRLLNSAPGGFDVTIGQLFADGKPLKQVDRRKRLRQLPGSWMVRADTSGLLVHFPRGSQAPSDYRTELTTRGRVFAPYKRGLGYIQVRGFTMEHGATNFPRGFWKEENPPQAGIVSTRAGHHWVIANNTIRFGKSLGLDIGTEGDHDFDELGQPEPAFREAGRHRIIGNVVSDNGAGGIEGIGSYGTHIVGNRIERNNRLGFTAPEVGGIKVHFFVNGLIEGNLLRDNDAYGIWVDNIWLNAHITRNVIIGNQGAGIFVELGRGPLLIDNNVIAFTRSSSLAAPGDGLYSHDASGVTFAHNLLFFNANFGLWAHVATNRVPGHHKGKQLVQEPALASVTQWQVIGNMFMGNQVGALSLPALTYRSKNNVSDYNLLAGSYDRRTVETYGDVLADPLFMVNTNKDRINLDSLSHQLMQELEQAGVPPSERPGRRRWQALPYLRLKEWRLLTGYDHHSHIPQILRPKLAADNLLLSFQIGPEALDVDVPDMKGVDRSLLGQPMPEHALPGPFQQLKATSELMHPDTTQRAAPYGDVPDQPVNSIDLWPVPVFDAQGDRYAIP